MAALTVVQIELGCFFKTLAEVERKRRLGLVDPELVIAGHRLQGSQYRLVAAFTVRQGRHRQIQRDIAEPRFPSLDGFELVGWKRGRRDPVRHAAFRQPLIVVPVTGYAMAESKRPAMAVEQLQRIHLGVINLVGSGQIDRQENG
ncbi:hypothetical protein D3C86_1670390 [compost metagenome]